MGTIATEQGHSETRRCLSPRRRGLLFALVGSLLDTPDAMLTRQIGELQSNGGTILFKYLFVAFITVAAAVYLEGGFRPLMASVRAGPLHVLAGSVFQVLASYRKAGAEPVFLRSA